VFLPVEVGVVVAQVADFAEAVVVVGVRPATPLDVGIGRFVDWYLRYHEA
jgi:UDP-glucuronate 4-epimerase